jgi:hypothetical protein
VTLSTGSMLAPAPGTIPAPGPGGEHRQPCILRRICAGRQLPISGGSTIPQLREP